MEGVQLKCEMKGGGKRGREKEIEGRRRRAKQSVEADSVEGVRRGGGEGKKKKKSRFDQGSWFNSVA